MFNTLVSNWGLGEKTNDGKNIGDVIFFSIEILFIASSSMIFINGIDIWRAAAPPSLLIRLMINIIPAVISLVIFSPLATSLSDTFFNKISSTSGTSCLNLRLSNINYNLLTSNSCDTISNRFYLNFAWKRSSNNNVQFVVETLRISFRRLRTVVTNIIVRTK